MSKDKDDELVEITASQLESIRRKDRMFNLEKQVARLKLYAPAQRTDTKKEPVARVGPTNFKYFGVTPE